MNRTNCLELGAMFRIDVSASRVEKLRSAETRELLRASVRPKADLPVRRRTTHDR